MTNHEKRALKARGLDWRKVRQERIHGTMQTLIYEMGPDGEPIIPEDQPDRGLAIHTAAALDRAINGRFTGSVTAPQGMLDQCARDTVAFGMRSLQEDPPERPRVRRMSPIQRMALMTALAMSGIEFTKEKP